MKTKLIAPWKLKAGQKILTFDMWGQERAEVVKSVKKKTGFFTGKSFWRIEFENNFVPAHNFHAKCKSLPLQKAKLVIG